MTIFYKFDGQMYINITNGCPCDCVFCLRNNSDSVKDNGACGWSTSLPSRRSWMHTRNSIRPLHARDILRLRRAYRPRGHAR